jgi:hypothetical protein
MAPALLVDVGFKAVRQPRRRAIVRYVADRAGHTGTAAIAALRAAPWASGMVLADPAGIGAEDAFHPIHLKLLS